MSSISQINYDTTPENLSAAKDELSNALGSDSINADQETCAAHSNSRFESSDISTKPHLIVYPKSTDQVSSILKICSKRCIPVMPYSGGTGLGNSLVTPLGGICIDFRDMQKIWDLHESDMDITVQSGVGWMELNAELASKGLFFPPDPAPAARIGGMVSFPRVPSNLGRQMSLPFS